MNTLNIIRASYITTKAALETARELQHEKYQAFLTSKGLVEKCYSLFKDDVEMDYDSIIAEYDVFAAEEIAITKIAYDDFHTAETVLIEYGISITPVNYQELLRHSVKYQRHNIDKLINILLKLDASTIPCEVFA